MSKYLICAAAVLMIASASPSAMAQDASLLPNPDKWTFGNPVPGDPIQQCFMRIERDGNSNNCTTSDVTVTQNTATFPAINPGGQTVAPHSQTVEVGNPVESSTNVTHIVANQCAALITEHNVSQNGTVNVPVACP